MEHKLIKTDNYLLVIDDKTLTSIPNNINVFSIRYNDVIRFAETENSYWNECYEIKAHLPLNNSPVLEGVDLLPPIEDEIEKLAEHLKYSVGNDGISSTRDFMNGYNKAKERYKYTEEDLRKVIELSREMKQDNSPLGRGEWVLKLEYQEDIENMIKYLQQPKLPVGFRRGEDGLVISGGLRVSQEQPVGLQAYPNYETITNSQGKTQWVGEYIY